MFHELRKSISVRHTSNIQVQSNYWNSSLWNVLETPTPITSASEAPVQGEVLCREPGLWKWLLTEREKDSLMVP